MKLFSASQKIGTFFNEVLKATPTAVETQKLYKVTGGKQYVPSAPENDSWNNLQPEQKAARSFEDYMIDLYDKVGAYYGWSWQEFIDTPYTVVVKLADRIDEKLDDLDNCILSWRHLELLVVLARAFGGKK